MATPKYEIVMPEGGYYPSAAMMAGETIFRESDSPLTERRLITPDEWDGLFPISTPIMMINQGSGWGTWCPTQTDLMATDWRIKRRVKTN